MKKILGRRDFLLTPNKTKNEVASLLIKPKDLKKKYFDFMPSLYWPCKKNKKKTFMVTVNKDSIYHCSKPAEMLFHLTNYLTPIQK